MHHIVPVRRTSTGRRCGLMAVGWLWFCSCTPLPAADSPLGNLIDLLFSGGREDEALPAVEAVAQPAAMVVELGPEAGAEFLPLLFKCAARELYFLKKVTQPNAEQYAALKVTAAKAARDLAREYAKAQQANRSPRDWPGPRTFIATALAERATAVLPAEVVASYREELDAREAAQVAAGQGMLLRAIDNRLTLLPEQVEPVQKKLVKHWDKTQSPNLVTYLYEQYLQFPSPDAFGEALNDRQKNLLRGGHQGRIGFSWEQELGLQSWNEDGLEMAGLEELSQVDVKPPTPEPGSNGENSSDVNSEDASEPVRAKIRLRLNEVEIQADKIELETGSKEQQP